MKITISKNVYHSLLVEAEDLRGIFDFLASKYKSAEAAGNCTDGSSLETQDIQELLAFENLNYRRLTSIMIKAKDDWEETLSFTIGSDRTSTAEIYLTSNNDEKALYISQEILKRLTDMKPSCDWVARASVLHTALTLFLVAWLILQIILAFGLARLEYHPLTITEYVNQNLFFVIILFAITYPLDALRRYLFPKVFFLIGKQKKTMETIRKWRSFIFITVILTIALGVITNWIYNAWF